MKRAMILAGGTGGHAMPALAVAENLRARGVEVIWLGTAAGVEADLARRGGFEFHSIYIKGLRGGGLLRALWMPVMLTWAMLQSGWWIWRKKPRSILSMGGFVAGPGGLVAGLLRRPLIIHEQNTVAGLTNKYLARFAARRLSGFPQAEGLKQHTWVGNPVRRAILDLPPPHLRSRAADDALRLLVLGGSQGARVFNETMPELLSGSLVQARRARAPLPRGLPAISVWHQCGRAAAATIRARYFAVGISCEVHGFIDDMAKAYAWCDAVICRAGAMTIAEICAAGVAAILVPYPHAAGDHQTRNAACLHNLGAAYVVTQQQFLRGDWLTHLVEFHRHPERRQAMATAARTLARPEAARAVAVACEEAMHA